MKEHSTTEDLHLEDQGTGNMPNLSGTWWWWWWHKTMESYVTKISYSVINHLHGQGV